MTDLEKWLEECKEKLEPPRPARVALDLLLKEFPKALRMLEVAMEYLKKRQGPTRISYDSNATRTLRKIDQIAKEK